MSLRGVAFFILAAQFGLTSSSSAQVLSTRLDLRACPEIDVGEAQKLIGIELRAAQISPPVDAQETDVVATCTNNQVRVDVHDPSVGDLARTLSWQGGEGLGRTRLFALAVAELLVAAHRDRALERKPQPSPPPQQTEAIAAVKTSGPAPAITRAAPTVRALHVQIGARHLGGGWTWAPLVGVGVFLPWRDIPGLGWICEGEGFAASQRVETGHVQLRAFAATPGVRWQSRPRRLQVQAQLGVNLGLATFAGQSNDDRLTEQSAFTTWAGPTAGALGRVAFGAWSIGLGFTAGYNLRPIQGNVRSGERQVDRARFSGLWQGVSLQLAHAF